MHTKRTGHSEFADKTAEAAEPISLEVPKVDAMSDEAVNATTNQPEGTTLAYCLVFSS